MDSLYPLLWLDTLDCGNIDGRLARLAVAFWFDASLLSLDLPLPFSDLVF